MIRASDATPDQVEVELDIFSGMPNPVWALTSEDSGRFVEKLTALPQIEPRPLAGNLGYRGLIVQLTSGSEIRTVRVQNGTVNISGGGAERYGRDDHRALERWLFATGRSLLAPEVIRTVERDLHD